MDSSLQKDQDDLEGTVNEKRILVVDDDISVRSTIKSLLEDEGIYSVQTARGGETAIKLLKQQTFDLLITDYNMPKMNGYELFKNCRGISSKLPVLFITGNYFNERVLEEVNSHANVDCIYKPFDAIDLFKIIDILIRMNTT